MAPYFILSMAETHGSCKPAVFVPLSTVLFSWIRKQESLSAIMEQFFEQQMMETHGPTFHLHSFRIILTLFLFMDPVTALLSVRMEPFSIPRTAESAGR